jgi:3-methyladenine DNA glycosylase/8-oxoguanine DNA glycosylase
MLVKDFSPFFTFSSGQVLNFIGEFKQKPIGISFATTRGIFDVRFSEVGKHAFEIAYDYKGDYSEKEAGKEVRKMLGLDSNMKEIYSKIGTDAFMKKAIKSFYGMRLTQSDPWITSVSFIISQFNNIKNIRNSVQKIMKKFGKKIDGKYLFPTCEKIAKASKSDLMSCGIGYRYTYLHEFANACLSGKINFNSLYHKNYEEAKKDLMQFKELATGCRLYSSFWYGKAKRFR